MVLKAIFLLSVFAIAIASVQASPIRSSLLARLWRRSTGTTTSSSTVHTTASPVPTGTATDEGFAPTPAGDSSSSNSQVQPLVDGSPRTLAIQCDTLASLARVIFRQTKRLSEDYEALRFPQGVPTDNDSEDLSYLALGGSSESLVSRERQPDVELVTRHYNNLFIVKDVLTQVKESETANITRRLDNIISRIESLIRELENTMELFFNKNPADERDVTTVAPFANESTLTDQQRNLRTLNILKACTTYMDEVRVDYKILKNRPR